MKPTLSKVKQTRIAHGLTAQECAEIIGCNMPTYYKKEAGELKFSLEQAKRLADHYGMTVDALFYASELSETENE